MLFNNLCVLFLLFVLIHCDLQVGPDPWDLEVNDKLTYTQNELDIPPDLRAMPHKKTNVGNGAGPGDWFYKRMLAIMLKAGQVKKEDDGSVQVSLQMKFEKERWEILEGYSAISLVLTEDMIRRSMGYIEEAIYKPTIVEKVSIAWSESVQFYLVEYKVYITWTLGVLAFLTFVLWLWHNVSHKHMYIVLFISLYLYEVFTSYKEAENKDLQRFLSAVNSCKWYFWSSQCDVPPPDPLIFIKYMNPLKIGIRMFSTIITEPMISISDTAKILIHGITDGLWFPFDKILYGILIINFNILLILFLIMIVFNYILNIPFNFSYLGFLNIGLKQRHRTYTSNGSDRTISDDSDRISGATLNRLLDVCSRALSTAEIAQNSNRRTNTKFTLTNSASTCRIRRSASTGRLPNTHNSFNQLEIEDSPKVYKHKEKFNGSGDGVCR